MIKAVKQFGKTKPSCTVFGPHNGSYTKSIVRPEYST